MELLPFNKEKAEELEREISKTFYQSIEQFIALYNNNAVDVNHVDIIPLANRIADTYKNIDLKKRKFIVRSAQEVTVETYEFLIPNFRLVTILKRIAYDIISDNHPNGVRLVFDPEKLGVVHFAEEDSVEYREYEAAERITGGFNELLASNPFLNIHLYTFDPDGDTSLVAIDLEDIIDIDTSLIDEMEKILAEHLEKIM